MLPSMMDMETQLCTWQQKKDLEESVRFDYFKCQFTM